MGKLGAGRVLALVLAVMAMFVVAACGDDDDSDSSSSGGGGETGGEISVGTTGLDNADPVHVPDHRRPYQPFQLAYVPLLTYAHKEGEAGSEIIPGLATEVPEPTNGGKTYEFTLREGLKYSDGSARQGQRLREHDQAPARSGQRLVVLLQPDHRGHRGVPGEAATSRATSRASRRTTRPADQDHAHRAGHQDPVRARRALRGAHPGGQVAGQEPQAAAPRRRAVHRSTSMDFNRLYELTRNPNCRHPGDPEGQLRQDHRSTSRDSVTKMTQDVITASSTS